MKMIIARPLKSISTFSNIEQLKQVRINAIKRGDLEFARMAQVRVWEILTERAQTIDEKFLSIVQIYEDFLWEKNRKNTKATRTRTKWIKDGTIKTASDIVRKNKSMGFDILLEFEKLKYSIEQFVIDNAFMFEAKIVAIARRKLTLAA